MYDSRAFTRASSTVFWLLFAVFCGCFAFIFFEFPVAYDDWHYLGQINYLGTDSDGHHTMLRGIKETLHSHFSSDTARAGNALGAVMLALSVTASKIIVICSFIWGLFLMLKATGIKADNPWGLSVLLFTVLFCVNWQEHMFSIMFGFNYVVVLPLFFGAILLLISKRRHYPAATAAVGLILGAWHEAFSLTFIIGAAVWLVIKPGRIRSDRISLLIAACIGFLWLIAWPAMWVRKDSYTMGSEGVRRLIYTIPWIAAMLFAICGWIRKRTAAPSDNALLIMTAVSGIVLVPMLIYTTHIRTLTPCYFLSACCLTRTAIDVRPKFFEGKTLRGRICLTVAGILTFVHLGAVCRETVLLKESVDKVVKAGIARDKSSNEFFAPVRYPWHASPLTLSRPDQDLFVPGWSDGFFQLKLFLNDYGFTNLIPAELQEFTWEKGVDLAGNAGCKIWKEYIVSSDLNEPLDRPVSVRYGPLGESTLAIGTVFHGKDGKKYLYLSPMRSKKSIFFGQPTSLDYVRD